MLTDPLDWIPRDPKDVTPQWLTARLKQAGVLASASVASVHVERATTWNVARLAHLEVEYDGTAGPAAPRRLFAKIAETNDPLADVFPGEYRFYVDTPTGGLPLAKCFGAFLDQRSGVTCILIEDLRDTHRSTPWPLPPLLPMCEAAVCALARLHARWWTEEDPRAGIGRAELLANESRLAEFFQALLPKFHDDLADRLAPERYDLMCRVCAKLPELKENRLAHGGATTRIHGDAHFWNVMYPQDPVRNSCVFIDWEDWRYDFGAADLAYMIALHWFPDRRARHEEHLLCTYLEVLQREVSTDYGWKDLQADYRLGHLQNIFVPIFQQQAGLAHGVWWSHLERWFLAFEDLGCGELL